MTMTTNSPPIVVSIDWSGVDVLYLGATAHITWGALDAAVAQSDRELSRVYRGLLEQARALARRTRTVRVAINNRAGAAFTHTPEIYDLAGQFVPGRIIGIGVEFGEPQWWRLAKMAADRAVAILRRRGYIVRVDY
jgi:hypothetical protein